jgi:hypothetical protein
MAKLGFRVGPYHWRKPDTADKWLIYSQIISGLPYTADVEQVLQRCNEFDEEGVRCICSIRPLQEWLDSCEQHFSEPNQHPKISLATERLFGSVIFDRKLWTDAYHRRISWAKHAAIPFLFLSVPGPERWRTLRNYVEWRPPVDPPYPHQNQTKKQEEILAYEQNELVA